MNTFKSVNDLVAAIDELKYQLKDPGVSTHPMAIEFNNLLNKFIVRWSLGMDQHSFAVIPVGGLAAPKEPLVEESPHQVATIYTNEDIKNEIDKQLILGEVFIRFATDVPGVVVPEDLKSEQYQNLKFSRKYRMSGGAGGCDLDVTDDHIEQTLGFNGRDIKCIVPFDAMCYVWVGPGKMLHRGEKEGSNDMPKNRPMLKLVT